MIVLLAILWWFVGFVSTLWIGWDRDRLTWGDLVQCLFIGGLLGPVLLVMVGIIMIVAAPFWNYPIFRKRKK